MHDAISINSSKLFLLDLSDVLDDICEFYFSSNQHEVFIIASAFGAYHVY